MTNVVRCFAFSILHALFEKLVIFHTESHAGLGFIRARVTSKGTLNAVLAVEEVINVTAAHRVTVAGSKHTRGITLALTRVVVVPVACITHLQCERAIRVFIVETFVIAQTASLDALPIEQTFV